MVTVIEYKSFNDYYELASAGAYYNQPEMFIQKAKDALRIADSETFSAYIYVTIYSYSGEYIDCSCFDNAKDADKWWTEKCFN